MSLSLIRTSFCLLGAILMEATTCDIESIPIIIDDGLPAAVVSDDSVRVRLLNQSGSALAVQLYASATAGDAETVLFTEANEIVAGIGFAGTGLIPAGDNDEALLLCDDAVMIGTRGGQFVDADTGDVLGTGQQRYLELGAQFDCGDTISIIYRQSGDEYHTSLLLD